MRIRDILTIRLFGVGAVITVTATFLSMANLGTFIKESNIPFFSLFVSLMAAFITAVFLMYERFASFEEEMRRSTDAAYRAIDERIRQQKVGAFTIFDNTADALFYEFHLLENAKRVWNTRLGTDHTFDIIDTMHRLRDKQDVLVAHALAKKGCHYELIVSNEAIAEIGKFRDLVAGIVNERPEHEYSTGEYSAWTLDKKDLPLLQMFIVELCDGSREALVGWINSDKRILRPCVLLFRDSEVVRFYLSVFDVYKDNATRVDMSKLAPH